MIYPVSVFKQAECNYLNWNTSSTLDLTAIKNLVKHLSYLLKSQCTVTTWHLKDSHSEYLQI